MCLELLQWVHFPSPDCPLNLVGAPFFIYYVCPDLTPLVAMITPLDAASIVDAITFGEYLPFEHMHRLVQ